MCMLAPSKAIQAPQHQRLSGKALLEQRSAWVQSLLPAFGTAPQSTNTTFLCTLAVQRTALAVEIHDLTIQRIQTPAGPLLMYSCLPTPWLQQCFWRSAHPKETHSSSVWLGQHELASGIQRLHLDSPPALTSLPSHIAIAGPP